MKFLLLLTLSAWPLLRASELQINSVPAGYTMTHYAFQADPETHRARIILSYTWPDTVNGGDTGPGLNSVPVQIGGLTYDASRAEIVFSEAGRQSVCATVRPRRFLLWSWTSVSPTGTCVVNSRRVPHALDTGLRIQTRETTDTFFGVQSPGTSK